MVIYLEGPDGSGKTTLAKEISEVCSAMSIPFKLAESDICTNPNSQNRVDRDKLISSLSNMLADDTTCYILDRGPISDCIYRLFDDYEPVMKLDEFLSFIYRYEPKLRLIYCNNQDAEKYMLERGDNNSIALKKHAKISYAYDMVMELMFNRLPWLRYDFTKKRPNLLMYEIKRFLRWYANK